MPLPCPVRLSAWVAIVAALTAVVAPATPAAATTSRDCTGARFTATAQADLARLAVLDAGVLRPGLPALADVRLAAAHGSVDSAARPHRSVAGSRYADPRLLDRQLPGLPRPRATTIRQAPPGAAPATETSTELNAGHLATVRSGRSTAEARWAGCGRPGPLTRSATTLAGVQLFAGGGTLPALRAMTRAGDAGERTSLMRLGPAGAARSATDLVRLDGGRIALSAAADAALSDLTLFGGTPQEVSVEVVTQPALTVVAAGDSDHSTVRYRPAELRVTAAGRPVTTLAAADDSVGVTLRGGLAAPALLTARLTLGGPRQEITGKGVRAEAAALRVEVLLGRSHVLDVTLGHLYAQASAPPMTIGDAGAIADPMAAGGRSPLTAGPGTVGGPAAPGQAPVAVAPPAAGGLPAVIPPGARERIGAAPGVPADTSAARPPARTDFAPAGQAGPLALTGAGFTVAAAGGLLLVGLGTGAALLARRRRAPSRD